MLLSPTCSGIICFCPPPPPPLLFTGGVGWRYNSRFLCSSIGHPPPPPFSLPCWPFPAPSFSSLHLPWTGMYCCRRSGVAPVVAGSRRGDFEGDDDAEFTAWYALFAWCSPSAKCTLRFLPPNECLSTFRDRRVLLPPKMVSKMFGFCNRQNERWFRQWFCIVRLYCSGYNLAEWDEFTRQRRRQVNEWCFKPQFCTVRKNSYYTSEQKCRNRKHSKPN